MNEDMREKMGREEARVNNRNPSRTGCELVEIGTKGITLLFLFFDSSRHYIFY